MRAGLFLCALLVAASASAEDARVKILQKQLSTAKDPRLRAQVCALLGKTGTAEAVQPLCSALQDGEAVVRSAAANALGELKAPDGVSCLKAGKDDPDASARKAIELALAANRPSGGLYVAIEVNDKVGSLPHEVLALAADLLKQKMAALGAQIAAAGESKEQSAAAIAKGRLRGYLLRSNLLPNGEKGLKLEILIMTYPDQALQGTWNVKASGGKHEKLLQAMVPRVVEDAANDLDWK